ncbi:uncharacterized protein LOC112512958 [Cynara cardunculus var. scolymus]|uniref:Uncharacterized protein n=1 Tax=Cynara cardunculus var. scolymus TaxID=59895 RepID=A0A118K1J5_CYNCS|nr:uncharacterized protein LOC112512958 [Cynara cardunculus var. scolymus]KVI02972.1 Protein of unknown function DUF241, plant [Cynara cardunculus var. scolymus]
MVVSLRFNSKFQKKSISLPCRSHPSTLGVEEELNKIKASSSTKQSADSISNGLSQLVELYNCLDDLLDSLATQNLISSHRKEIWVEEVMEESMKLLDVCSTARDVVLQMEEHVRDIQCALRRRKSHTSVEDSIGKYKCFRKKTMKEAKVMIIHLKQSEKVMGLLADPDNHHLMAMIRVFMEVTEMTVIIFESLLMFLASPVTKRNGWSVVVSKLISKRTMACQEDKKQEGITNELETLDVALFTILCDGHVEWAEKTRIVQFKLEGLQGKMMRIESGLECMFRRFVKTRTTLLNIISL